MDIVDYNTDCRDSSSHLNPSGGYKVTDYIGQYIIEHYDIPDQRNNPAFDSWYEDYRKWTEEKINILENTDQLDVYLMLLADQHQERLLIRRSSHSSIIVGELGADYRVRAAECVLNG